MVSRILAYTFMTMRTFRLEISVDEAHEMEVFECGSNFGGVEAGSVFVDTLVGPGLQSSEELASTAVFHAEV